MNEPAFIAVDWGTSSFRLWVMDAAGAPLAARKGAFGMATLEPHEFSPKLEEVLAELDVAADIPAVVCGMAGSAQGWRQAPYLDVPTPLAAVAGGAVEAPGSDRDVRIMPGLAQRGEGEWDVMRGEETLLLGAALEGALGPVACLPGTHSKWVSIEDGAATGFATAMTGEFYALLSGRSVLSHSVAAFEGDLTENAAFARAVRLGAEDPAQAMQSLFTIRAESLLSEPTAPADMGARLSGLLIGVEIAGMAEFGDGAVTLISGGTIGGAYARAFDLLHRPFTMLDAEGLAQAGLFSAARALWPGRFA